MIKIKQQNGGICMLSCNSCSYMKKFDSCNSDKNKQFCELTGFVFHKEIEDYEMENHPCYEYKLVENEEIIIESEFVENEEFKTA